MAAISARSRNPDTESFGIESNNVLASSRLQTGVLPFLTTYFGPRTEWAGFDGVICRTTRKSYSIRTAASFCLMVGLDPGKSSIQAATWNGRTVVSSRPSAAHQSKNCQQARVIAQENR